MNDQFLEDDILIEEEQEDDDITISYDIATYPSDFTLAGIFKMWVDGDITIPDFQREFVWTIRQSSLLIDSFLSGLPIPNVFFYIDDQNKNLVIDGQQRILSVVFFFQGYFGWESLQGKRQVFRLTGLADNSPYRDKKYDELSPSDQRKLNNAVMRAVNIRQLSPADENTSAYHIFERLNTGGTPLRPQEIRNVVFRGEFNKQLKDANNDPNWRKIIGRPYREKHQKDVEFILRIFSMTGLGEKYEKPMKEFLNKSMRRHQKGETKKAKAFFDVFPSVSKRVVEALGEKPFHIRGPLNMSVLDSVMSVLIENHKKINWKTLSADFALLVGDREFEEYTRYNTTDKVSIEGRISRATSFLVHK